LTKAAFSSADWFPLEATVPQPLMTIGVPSKV
jgi:hypothetical protein